MTHSNTELSADCLILDVGGSAAADSSTSVMFTGMGNALLATEVRLISE